MHIWKEICHRANYDLCYCGFGRKNSGRIIAYVSAWPWALFFSFFLLFWPPPPVLFTLNMNVILQV